MIRLNNSPIEGSTVRLNLSFRDSFGNYYVPTEVNYTILALNDDMESWRVVDNVYEVPLEPSSMIAFSTPSCEIISGTTPSRKIVVKWTAYVDDTYSNFVDEVEFSVQKLPYVTNAPTSSIEKPKSYVKVSDVKLQIGSLLATPTDPTFYIKTNIPCVATKDSFYIVDDDENRYDCSYVVDSTNSKFTVSAVSLNNNTNYYLVVSNLKSTVSETEMENDFYLSFTTVDVDYSVEDNVTVNVTENGTVEVTADEGYDSMKKVTINVSVTYTIALYAYRGDDTKLYYSTREIDATDTYNIFRADDFENIDYRDVTVGADIVLDYGDETVTLLRDNNYDVLK